MFMVEVRRMSRKIRVATWAMSNGQIATVEVSYPTMGGSKKEYCLSVQPTTIDDRGLELYFPRQGYRYSLETAARFSEKKLEALSLSPDTFRIARGMLAQCEDDLKMGKW
jgi:hypothetical protein